MANLSGLYTHPLLASLCLSLFLSLCFCLLGVCLPLRIFLSACICLSMWFRILSVFHFLSLWSWNPSLFAGLSFPHFFNPTLILPMHLTLLLSISESAFMSSFLHVLSHSISFSSSSPPLSVCLSFCASHLLPSCLCQFLGEDRKQVITLRQYRLV